MVRKIILLIILLAIVPLIIAADTTLKIKTLSDHRISVIVREAEKLTTLESFHKDTGTGELEITSSQSVSSLDIIVTLKKDTNTILNKKFEAVVAGEKYVLDFVPGNVNFKTQAEVDAEAAATTTETQAETPVETAEPASETQAETPVEAQKETTQPTTENVEEIKNSKVSGLAIFSNKDTAKKLYYGIGIIAALAIVIGIFFFARKKLKANSPTDSFRVRKLSEIKGDHYTDKKLHDAEKRIEEAKREIEEIKNKDIRVKQLKEQYEHDKRELKRLGINVQ